MSIIYIDSLTPKATIMTRGQYLQKKKVDVKLGLMILLIQ